MTQDILNDITSDTCEIQYIFEKDVKKLDKMSEKTKKQSKKDIEEEIEEAPEDWENPDSWTKEVVERFICVNPDFLGDYSGFPALNDYEDPFSAKIEE